MALGSAAPENVPALIDIRVYGNSASESCWTGG
jgi:hypothetical protein